MRCAAPFALILLIGLLSSLLSGCAYRIVAPAKLGESLAIRISENKSRLVRSQAALQRNVGRAIQQRLGWDISADGSSHLSLAIAREEISVAARTSDDSPQRWKIVLKATATIHSDLRYPASRSRSFSGTGYANGRQDEPKGLAAAANSMAAKIADWLEEGTDDWEFNDPRSEGI